MERFGPTHRGGPVFRWLGEPLPIDLANTVMVVREGEIVDLLDGPGRLALWLDAERERLGDCDFALAHLDEVRGLRDAIRGLLAATARGSRLSGRDLAHLNAASAAAPIAPQLDADGWSAEAVGRAEPLAQLLAALARSTITLLSGPEREQLRICHAPSCGMFFLGTRRWCCAACGNRARAARHYRRSRP